MSSRIGPSDHEADLTPQEFWDRRLSAEYDFRGVGCRRLGWSYNFWLYRVRRQVFSRLVRDLPTRWREARVADIGSGTGFYVELWRRLGARSLVGLDFTATAVTRLSARYPQFRFVQADISQPLAVDLGGPFDAISAIDVLFHILNDAGYARALQTLGTLLRPGGHLMFTDCFVHGATQRGKWFTWRPLTEIMQRIEDAGMRVVARRPVFVLMNAPVDSSRRVAHRWWELLMRLTMRGEPVAFLAGALLYPLELALANVLREGPSTEIVVCQKTE